MKITENDLDDWNVSYPYLYKLTSAETRQNAEIECSGSQYSAYLAELKSLAEFTTVKTLFPAAASTDVFVGFYWDGQQLRRFSDGSAASFTPTWCTQQPSSATNISLNIGQKCLKPSSGSQQGLCRTNGRSKILQQFTYIIFLLSLKQRSTPSSCSLLATTTSTKVLKAFERTQSPTLSLQYRLSIKVT